MDGLEFKGGRVWQLIFTQQVFDVFEIMPQSLQVDPAAHVRKTVQPLPAAPEHFQRPAEIAALDVVISDADLEDAAI